MQNNIRKAFVAALLAAAAFGVSFAAPGGAAPGMPRPPWAQPDGVATATSVKTTTARLGSLRRDDTVVVAVEGVVADPGVDTNAVRAIVAEYCGTNIVPRVDAMESGLSDVEEWQRTNGLYSAVAELGDSVSAALAAKADGTVVERGVYSPAMDTNDVWVVDMDGTVLRFLDADPAAGTVTWRGVCASNTLWVSGSTTSAPPEIAYSLTTLETGAERVLASVDVVDAATGARCGIPRSVFDGTGTGVAYLAPSYDQAGPGDLQYSYTVTVRPLGSGGFIFRRTDSGAFAEVMRFLRGRVVDAETSVVYDADLRRRLAELRAAVVSRDAATSGFTEWAVSTERPVTGEVVVAAFPAGSAPSGLCDWSLFYADDAVRDDSTRLADTKRASSAATNLVWAASETSWGISVTACRVRVPTVADIEGVQAVAGKHYDDANAMFARLLHYATNNYYSAYLANERAKNLEAWQYTNAVGRADIERGMTDWAMTPMWPIGYVDAGQVLDGSDAGKWSLFPTGATHTASNALLPAIDGAKNSFGDVVELLWPDASWRVEERWTNSLDKLGLRWTPDPGDGYVTAHFDARAARTRVVTMEDVYSLSTNMAQTVTGLVDGVSERLDRLGADLASAARLSLPGECFPVTYMAGSSPPVTIGGADGLSFREDGGVVRMGDAASGRYICSFDPGTLRFLESPYGDALLFGHGYSPGASNEWPVLSVAVCGAPVVPAGRTVNGKALTNDVTLTAADIPVDATQGAQNIDAALAGKRDYTDLSYDTAGTIEVPVIRATVSGNGQSIVVDLECNETVPDLPVLNHVYTWQDEAAGLKITQGCGVYTTTWTLYVGGSVADTDSTQNATQGYYPDLSFSVESTGGTVTTTKTTAQKTVTHEDSIALTSQVPTVVVPSTSASDSGKAADAKATGDALARKQDALTFDNAPTAGSNNPVKSGGTWSALWGTASTAFSSLYDWCVAQLTDKRDKTDLAVYERREGVDRWDVVVGGTGATTALPLTSTSGISTTYSNGNTYGCYKLVTYDYRQTGGDEFLVTVFRNTGITSIQWAKVTVSPERSTGEITETEAAAQGLRFVHVRQEEGLFPTEDTLAKVSQMNAAIDPLLFVQYYPEGNVKSAAEFTTGIKYDTPDTANRTITVRPFCDTVSSANNSGLIGRVVIPPFVDVGGYGYISDNGKRYKVVGVHGGSPRGVNTNLTEIVAPSTMITVGNNAFDSCTSLTSVSLPSATTIGEDVFASCTSLSTVDFGDTPRSSVPTLGIYVFDGVPEICKIIVPYTQYDEWIAADGWKDLPQEFVRHAEKADKPVTFTPGNLAEFDANGNPADSGKSFEDVQSQIDTESPLLARSFAVQRQSGWREASGATGTAGNSVIFFRPRYFGMKDGDLFKGIVLQTRADQRTVFSNGVYMRLRAVPADQSAPWPTLGVSELTVWPDTPKTDVVFRLPRAVSLPSSGSYYALDFVLDPDGGTQAFGMMAYGLQSGSNPDFYFALSTIVPVATAQFYSWEELTGADIAVSGTDATKVSAALAGKLDKSGGTVTGDIHMPNGQLDAGDVVTRSYFDFSKPNESPKYLDSPQNSGKALTDADLEDSSSALGAAFAGKQPALSAQQLANIAAVPGKLDKSGGTVTGALAVAGPEQPGWPVFEVVPSADGLAPTMRFSHAPGVVGLRWKIAQTSDGHYNVVMEASNELGESRQISLPSTAGTLALLSNLTGDFSSSTAYAKDALVVYSGALYRCVNPNGHTGAWVDADFTSATVEDVLASLRQGKIDKSGGMAVGTFGVLDPEYPDVEPVFSVDGTNSGSPTMRFGDSAGVVGITWCFDIDGVVMDVSEPYGHTYRIALPTKTGTLAIAAEPNHAGNLAALDANGNPTDSGMALDDIKGANVRIGQDAVARQNSVAIGRAAGNRAGDNAVVVGYKAVLGNEGKGGGNNCVVIGSSAQVNSKAQNQKAPSDCMAIGKNAKVYLDGGQFGAVQIGEGVNNEAKSLKFRDTVVVGGDGRIPLSSTDMLDADTGKATFSDGITVQGSGASAMFSPSSSPIVGAQHHSVTFNSDNIVFAATEPGPDVYTYTYPHESGRLVVDTQLVRRYPMFVIDLNPDDQRIWNHFELKASTNNFTNATSTNMLFFTASTVNGVTNAEFDVGYPYDWCRLYVLSGRAGGGAADPRSWTRIRNTAELDTYAPLAVAVIVDMEMLKRGQGSEWLYEDNEEIVWSYLRIGLDSAERDQTGARCWRPVSPVRWYRKLPQWAEQECTSFSTSGIQPYETPLDGDE